jgi:hypothetical protein
MPMRYSRAKDGINYCIADAISAIRIAKMVAHMGTTELREPGKARLSSIVDSVVDAIICYVAC